MEAETRCLEKNGRDSGLSRDDLKLFHTLTSPTFLCFGSLFQGWVLMVLNAPYF